MKFPGPLAAALAAVLLGAAHPAAPTQYAAPAGDRPAGSSRLEPVDAVLPNGKTAAPYGGAIFVGTDPLGLALSPDGRFAVVSNDLADPGLAPPAPASGALLHAGYSLSVVDTSTMRVASVYSAPGLGLYCGVAVVRDPGNPSRTLVLASDGPNNNLRTFVLGSDGSLSADTTIPVPGFPARIAVSADGRMAYVSAMAADSVRAIDIASRRLVGSASVGYGPFGIGRSQDALYVANGGLAHYQALAQPAAAPTFAAVSGNPSRSSALSIVPLDAAGQISGGDAAVTAVRLDPVPDGVDVVGGAHPGSVVVRRDGRFAYVSLGNVDRISTVALGSDPRVVGGLDIRLFVNAPYGTQPDAEALAPDGNRLYVALAGLNAVAVLDATEPAQLHRLGLIPTGDFPSALAMSPDGRFLYVTSAGGVDGWGLLQRIDLRSLAKTQLVKATLSALRYNRAIVPQHATSAVPTLRSDQRSSVIDRVVFISVGSATFDGIFGDLGIPESDPAMTAYGASLTPNLHALARTYGVATNFYLDRDAPALNMQYALAGIASAYAQRMQTGQSDPEEYPRAGYLFNALARERRSFRDYGGLLNLSGYQPFVARPQQGRTPAKPVNAQSLGGAYTLDVPALAALDGHVDLQYPGVNSQISAGARADEFIRDMGALEQSGQEPEFTYVWLPADGGASMADEDRAVGKIVGFLSHSPHWSSTAVIVAGSATSGSSDHINRARSFALVISPLAKSHYVGHRHLSTASIVKTEEELLGLPPLSLGDLLASDMADFFGDIPYPTIYQPLP